MLLGQLGQLGPRTAGRWAGSAGLLLLLLLQAVTGALSRTSPDHQPDAPRSAAGASQCRQGAIFSQAVVAPEGCSVVAVPGAVTLRGCVAACCDLPGSDRALLLRGRCYALSCQRGRRGADSVLVFLPRASVVRAEPREGRWRPAPLHLEGPGDPEGPGNLESLGELVQQSPPESRTREDLEDSPEGPETSNQPSAAGGPNQSQEGEGPGQGAEGGTRRPAEPRPHPQIPAPTTPDSSHHQEVTSLPASARPVSTPPPADPPLVQASGNPVDHRELQPTAGAAPPPVAHAGGSHTLTLPNNSLVLRGSVTGGDQSELRYLWLRDLQSPAAGDVLFASDRQPSLYLSNLVQGTYLFRLQVTDGRGRRSSAAATVEVRAEPGGGQEVELEMLVPVWRLSLAQRDTLLRQLAALLHVRDAQLQPRALQGRSPSSTVLRFSVAGPAGPVSASRLVLLLRKQLLGQEDLLLFRLLRAEPVSCPLRCSGRGQCDPVSKQCRCEPFWTENLLRRYLGDGESNCEWRLLYLILSSSVVALLILTISWTFVCCCRRRETKGRWRSRYTILDNVEDQERVELRPRFCLRQGDRPGSSQMVSERALDSGPGPGGSRPPPPPSADRASATSRRQTVETPRVA